MPAAMPDRIAKADSPPSAELHSSRPSFTQSVELRRAGAANPARQTSLSWCSGRRWRAGHEYPLWANTHSRSTDIPRCSPAEVNSTRDSDQNWANRWNLFSDSVRSEPNRRNSVFRSVLFSASCFNLGLPSPVCHLAAAFRTNFPWKPTSRSSSRPRITPRHTRPRPALAPHCKHPAGSADRAAAPLELLPTGSVDRSRSAASIAMRWSHSLARLSWFALPKR
jgi:hypothetical protein